MPCPHSDSFTPDKCALCIHWARSPEYRRLMAEAGMPEGGLRATGPFEGEQAVEETDEPPPDMPRRRPGSVPPERLAPGQRVVPRNPPPARKAPLPPRKQAQARGPGLLRKTANATVAAAKAARNALLGKKVIAPPEVVRERRAACDSCDLRDPVRDACTHQKCGCFLSRRLTIGVAGVPGKLEVASESCPAGKWAAVE